MQNKKRSRTPDGSPAQETFSSLDVSRMTGVSLRQLQWWDEQKVVSPEQRGHRRIYRMNEVICVGLITELRQKGISLQKVRKVLKYLEKQYGRNLESVFRNGAETHLLTDGKNIYLEDDYENIVNILKNARQPIISVCVSDQIERLSVKARLRKGVQSETRPASARASRAVS